MSNLSKAEFPNEQFVVVPIDGLTTARDIDPRIKEVGYMCLVESNYPQKKHWFNDHITYPMVKTIRRMYNPLSTSDTNKGEVPIDQHVCMWGRALTFPICKK